MSRSLRDRPLLAAMAGNIFYVGGAGAGCIAKLVTQVAALEGMLIGAKAGIDLGTLARIAPLSAGASRTFDNIPRSVLPGSFTAGGTLDIVAKDLDLACDLARQVGARAHLGLLAHDVLSRAQAQGWGNEGFPVAALILEAMAGAELRASVRISPPIKRQIRGAHKPSGLTFGTGHAATGAALPGTTRTAAAPGRFSLTGGNAFSAAVRR